MTSTAKMVMTIIVGALLVGLIIWAIKKGREDYQWIYDERQIVERRKAANLALCILVFYNLAYGISDTYFNIKYCDTFTGCMMGLCLAMIGYMGYCIWKDAYMSVKKDRQYSIVLSCAPIAVVYLIEGIDGFMSGEIFTDGRLNDRFVMLQVAISYIVILIIYGIKKLSMRRECE